LVRFNANRCDRPHHNMVAFVIYDRESKEITNEQVYKDRTMRFLYGTVLGGFCVLFLRLPVVSRIYGLSQKSIRSKVKIARFIDQYAIDIEMVRGGVRGVY